MILGLALGLTLGPNVAPESVPDSTIFSTNAITSGIIGVSVDFKALTISASIAQRILAAFRTRRPVALAIRQG